MNRPYERLCVGAATNCSCVSGIYTIPGGHNSLRPCRIIRSRSASPFVRSGRRDDRRKSAAGRCRCSSRHHRHRARRVAPDCGALARTNRIASGRARTARTQFLHRHRAPETHCEHRRRLRTRIDLSRVPAKPSIPGPASQASRRYCRESPRQDRANRRARRRLDRPHDCKTTPANNRPSAQRTPAPACAQPMRQRELVVTHSPRRRRRHYALDRANKAPQRSATRRKELADSRRQPQGHRQRARRD